MKLKLIAPGTTSRISGLEDPKTFYEVITEPAPLAGMRQPSSDTPWYSLKNAGYRYIVCLTEDGPKYDPSPMEILSWSRMEDLAHERQPAAPEREHQILKDVVSNVTEKLNSGDGVLVHCFGGTGRTGTVIACTLREMGRAVKDIKAYMDKVNDARGKSPGWPESNWQKQQLETWSGL